MDPKKKEDVGMNPQAPHGLPIKVFAHDGTSIETIMFASARKDPKLLGMIKKIDKAERDIQRLQAEAELFYPRISAVCIPLNATGEDAPDKATVEAAIEGATKLRAELDGLIDKTSDLDESRLDAICSFYEAGLTAAGYNDEMLELHYPLLSVRSYPEIRLICRTGCGIADFTKAG